MAGLKTLPFLSAVPAHQVHTLTPPLDQLQMQRNVLDWAPETAGDYDWRPKNKLMTLELVVTTTMTQR